MDNNDTMAIEPKPISFKDLVTAYKPPKQKPKNVYSDAAIRTYFDIRIESRFDINFSQIQDILMLIWKFMFLLSRNRKFTIKVTKLYMSNHEVRDLKELVKTNANPPTNC